MVTSFSATSSRSLKPLPRLGIFLPRCLISDGSLLLPFTRHHEFAQSFLGTRCRGSDGCSEQYGPRQQYQCWTASYSNTYSCGSCHSRHSRHPYECIGPGCAALEALQCDCHHRQVVHDLVPRPDGGCCQPQVVHRQGAYHAHHHQLPLHAYEGKDLIIFLHAVW